MADKKEKKTTVERTYNVPLRKEWLKVPRYKRSKKAVKALKEFLSKHMKSDNVRIGMHLNEFIWKDGIKNPPHHVKVHVEKDDEEVRAELAGFDFKEAVKAKPKEEKATGLKGKLEEAMSSTKEPKAEEKKAEKKDEKKEEVAKEPKVKEETKKPATKTQSNKVAGKSTEKAEANKK